MSCGSGNLPNKILVRWEEPDRQDEPERVEPFLVVRTDKEGPDIEGVYGVYELKKKIRVTAVLKVEDIVKKKL